MAPSISSAPIPAEHLEQLAALRALAAELSGERRSYQRQSLEPRLTARLQLHAGDGSPIPLLLIDLGSGGTRAVAPLTAPLRSGATGVLITGNPGRGEGQRQVQVRWVHAQTGAVLLGLSFERQHLVKAELMPRPQNVPSL